MGTLVVSFITVETFSPIFIFNSQPSVARQFISVYFFSSNNHRNDVSASWEIGSAATPLFRAFILWDFISQSQAFPLFLNNDSSMTYITHDNPVGILGALDLGLSVFLWPIIVFDRRLLLSLQDIFVTFHIFNAKITVHN